MFSFFFHMLLCSCYLRQVLWLSSGIWRWCCTCGSNSLFGVPSTYDDAFSYFELYFEAFLSQGISYLFGGISHH
jgi:hypothetical protein